MKRKVSSIYFILLWLRPHSFFKEIWIDSKDNEVVWRYDGMVYIADLKSVPFEGCGFESHYLHWAHRNLYKSGKCGASLKIGYFKDKTSTKTHWVVWVKIFLSNATRCGGNLAKEYVWTTLKFRRYRPSLKRCRPESRQVRNIDHHIQRNGRCKVHLSQ